MDRNYNIIAEQAAVKLAAGFASAFTEEALVSASNKGTYKRALKDIAEGEFHASAAENGAVKVELSDAQVFMIGNIADCKCSCSSKTVCRHIISAAILLSGFSDGAPQEKTEPEAKAEKDDEKQEDTLVPDKFYLNEVMTSAGNILVKGIVSCTENDMQTMERLSVGAPTVHRSISRMCRSLSQDIRLMLEKHTAFDQLAAAKRLCRIYNTAEASLKEQGKPLLFSGNDYETDGSVNFVCAGIYPYRSKSGFAGITAVLFERDLRRYYTFNTAVADVYENTANAGSIRSLEKQLGAHMHWQNKVSLANINGRSLKLTNCMADKERKISSSSKSTCMIGSMFGYSDLPKKAFEFEEEEAYDYFIQSQRPLFCVVRSERLGELYYDKGTQTLHYNIHTENGIIPCATAYSEVSANAVSSIEMYGKRPDRERYFLLRRFGQTTHIISEIMLSGVINIYFDSGRRAVY